MKTVTLYRVAAITTGVVGLVVVFLFQKTDVAELFLPNANTTTRFVFNRSFRFLLNDVLALAIIYGLFQERKYIIFALWVQVAGFVFFLMPYFVIRIYFPSYNGPLISYLHRLILNPTLLLLLIPAFYFQKSRYPSKPRGNTTID